MGPGARVNQWEKGIIVGKADLGLRQLGISNRNVQTILGQISEGMSPNIGSSPKKPWGDI